MRKLTAAVLLAAALFASACSDKNPDRGMPTAPRLAPSQPNYAFRPGTCFTAATVTTLVKTMLGAGHPALNTALQKLTAMIVFVVTNKIPQAQAAARDLIAFLNSQITPNTPPSQKAQIQATINAILCFVGLPLDTFVVLPSTEPQTIVTSDGNTGITIPGGGVTVPTTLTITTLDPNGPSGLVTKLDQYPTFINVTSSSQLHGTAVVAICLGVSVPTSVFNRLRIGHQATGGFEITDRADPSFLNCPTTLPSVGSASRVPGWLKSVASLVLPKVLYARQDELRSGGVGGSATEFSPFDAVDPELRASGGVGGSATEFQRKTTGLKLGGASPPDATAQQPVKSLTPGVRLNNVSGGTCTLPLEYTVGTDVEALCRPVITVTTAKGTILTNVPVSWSVSKGGGGIKPNTVATQTCSGAAGATASTLTDALGKAGVCWTLGAEAGLNEVVATPSAGGDAPAGVTFVPLNMYYAATALKAPATLLLGNLSQTYDGTPKSATASTSPGSLAVVSITYNGSTTVPTAAGTYTVVATLTNASFQATDATGTLTIGLADQAALSITGSSPATFGGGTVPLTPSGGSGTGALTYSAGSSTACSVDGSTGGVTITHGTGSCDLTATKAADANYKPATSPVFSIVVNKANQTALSITGSSPATFGGGTVPLTPSGGSGTGALSYTAGSSTACSVDGSTGVVTITHGTGSCDLAATKAADADYNQVTSAVFSITVAKANQAGLSVTGANTGAFGGASLPHGTSGGSGTGAVTFSGSGTACTVDAAGTATITGGTGSCDLTATKAGDADYNQATSPVFSITVSKAAQAALSVTGASAGTFGGASLAHGTSGGSGTGAVTFSGSGTACTVDAAGTVTITHGSGSCDLTATKAADSDYTQATSPVFSVTVSKAAQGALSVTGANTGTFGGAAVPHGTSGGSGTGAVTFSGSGTACTVDAAGTATITSGTGSCDLTATKAADGDYNQATSPVFSITVSKANQSISFGALPGRTYGDAAFGVTATATSGLAVGFGAAGNCTMLGSNVTITGAGNCTVTASQSGSTNYNAATPVPQMFAIAKHAATATAGSGIMSLGGSVPSLPCLVGGLLAPDAGTVTCATSVPGTLAPGDNVTTPNVSPSSPPSYSVTKVNGTLTVRYVQSGCFASPIFNTMPSTSQSSNPRKGTKVTVKCRLVDATGRPVVTATGNLLVQDKGTNGLAAPVTVFSGNNVFDVSDDHDYDADDGFYTNLLSTSPTAFVVGHYYFVTATWSDGSTTTGWFYLKAS